MSVFERLALLLAILAVTIALFIYSLDSPVNDLF